MSQVTIETFSPSLASAHSLAPSEMNTTLSAQLAQPEGGALAAAMLWLSSREFSEKTHSYKQVGGGEERALSNGFPLIWLRGKSYPPEDLSIVVRFLLSERHSFYSS